MIILTISLVGWDGELPLFAYTHAKEAFVPSPDDLSYSEGEFERIGGVARGVEPSTCAEECSFLGVGSTHRRWLGEWNNNKQGRTYLTLILSPRAVWGCGDWVSVGGESCSIKRSFGGTRDIANSNDDTGVTKLKGGDWYECECEMGDGAGGVQLVRQFGATVPG